MKLRRSMGVWIATLLTLRSHAFAPASAGTGFGSKNLWWYEADPFVSPGLLPLGELNLQAWTTALSGGPGSPLIFAERVDETGNLESAGSIAVAPAPPGAGFALLNQYAPDISVFSLRNPAPALPPGDANGNGIADAWETKHFGAAGFDPGADTDGDGFTNRAEFEAGTNPLDASSRPTIPGIVGLWAGENSTVDLANGHDGVWQGRPEYGEGRLGRAFVTSSSSWVRVDDAADMRPESALSIAGWIRLRSSSCNLQPLLWRESSRAGIAAFGLAVNCQGPRLILGTAFANLIDGPAVTLATGVWYHVAATWDGTNALLYLNGRAAFGSRRPSGFGPLDTEPGKPLLLGGDGRTQFLDGLLDQVILAKRALSSEEIRWLAGGNDGARGAVPDSVLLLEREDHSVWHIGLEPETASYLTHGYDAHLSSDRRKLLFRREQTTPGAPGFEQIWFRDLITGTEMAIDTLGVSGNAISLDWDADGTGFVIADSRSRQIRRQSLLASVASQTLLVDTASLGGSPEDLNVSRADGRLAWFMSSGNFNIDLPWVAREDGSSPSSLPKGIAAEGLPRPRHPSWSPDGSQIALTLGRNLILHNVADGSQLRLTPYVGSATDPAMASEAPAWTVDSRQVVTVASFPQSDPAPIVLYVATDGSGTLQRRKLPGAPPKRVVFAGTSPGASEVNLSVRYIPPQTTADAPILLFTAPSGEDSISLVSASDLIGEWHPHAALAQHSPTHRKWWVRINPGEAVRFFRIQRTLP